MQMEEIMKNRKGFVKSLSAFLTLVMLLGAAALTVSAEAASVIVKEIPFIEITAANASSFGNATSYSASIKPEGAATGSITGLNRPVAYWTPTTPVQEPVNVIEKLGVAYTAGKSSDLGVAFDYYIGDQKSLDALKASSTGLTLQIGTTSSTSGPCYTQQAAGANLAGLHVGWNQIVFKNNAAWMSGGTPDLAAGVTWVKFRMEGLGTNGTSFAINNIRLVKTTQTATLYLMNPEEEPEAPEVTKVKKEVTDGTGVIVKQLSFIDITNENAGKFGSSSSASGEYLPEGGKGLSLTGFNRTVVYWAPQTPLQDPIDTENLGVTFEKKKSSDLGVAFWLYIHDAASLNGLVNSNTGLSLEIGTGDNINGPRWCQQAKLASLKELRVGWNEVVIKQNAAWVSGGDPDLADGIRLLRIRLEDLGATGLSYAISDIRLVRTTQTDTLVVNNAQGGGDDEETVKVEAYLPTDITIQPGKDESEIGVNWMVYGEPSNPVLELNRKGETAPAVIKGQAVKTGFSADGLDLYAVKVTVTGLAHSGEYEYRVGDDHVKSVKFTYKTPAADSFKALVLSDIHIIEDLNWGRELKASGDYWRKSLKHYSEKYDFSLIVSLGDQMQNTTKSSYFDQFLSDDLLNSYAISVLNGNHDTSPESQNMNLYFNQCNQVEGTAVSNMGDYYYRYGNTLFIMLNISQNDTAKKYDHSKVFEEAVKAFPDYKWLVVGAHYPIYGPSSDVANPSMETITKAYESVCSLLDEYHADLFINGHTHVYARTHLIKNGQITDGSDPKVNTYTNADGTVYMTMSCATEMWELIVNEHSKGGAWIKTELENVPTYQMLEVTGDKLVMNVYSLKDDSLIDSLTLIKAEEEPVETEEPSQSETEGQKDPVSPTTADGLFAVLAVMLLAAGIFLIVKRRTA